MAGGLIILLLICTSNLVRGLTRYDNFTCYDKTARKYYCCSDYEEINDECIKCKLGFISRKGNSCEPCAFNYFGNNCLRECMCNELQRCDNVKGCVEIETTSTLTTKSNITEIISSEESVTKVHEEEKNDVTTQSNIAETISSEESVTKVHEEEKNDDLSKTELLILFCGVLSGIIGLLGILRISKFVKKHMRMSKSKRDKLTEEEVHTSEEPGTQEVFALQENLYEIIDDSHLDSILLPQTCNRNPESNDEQQSSGISANWNDDRSSYLEPLSSPVTKKSSFQKEKQSQMTFPPARKSTCIENQASCSPNLEIDDESSNSGSSTHCIDDRSIYVQPLSSLITKDSSCHTEEQSRQVFPSAIYSTCIADQTSCDPYMAIEEDDSDDSSSEFSEDAKYDRSSYLHPYNTLLTKTSSCHIYEICQNGPFPE